MQYVYPISYRRFSVITIGHDNTWRIATGEMEQIRDWFLDHKDNYEQAFKECPYTFNYNLSLEIFPTGSPDQEYVLLVEYEGMHNSDEKVWKSLLERSQEDDNFILFTIPEIKVRRINKVLLPFI